MGRGTGLAVLEIGFSQANKTLDVPVAVAGAKNVFITFRARVFCATHKILEASTTTTTIGAAAGAGAVEQEQLQPSQNKYQAGAAAAAASGIIPGAATPTLKLLMLPPASCHPPPPLPLLLAVTLAHNAARIKAYSQVVLCAQLISQRLKDI